MTAYVIVDAEIQDEERARAYRAVAVPSVLKYGGRYLVAGATPETAVGSWPAAAVTTVIEFPDMDRLREWHASAEYAAAKELRAGAFKLRLLFAEGIAAA
ncbi:DUF1330 domain-containing protein [Nocardia sp. CA-128927]|uniref:DUF1330 domain-containing protein n=1 Tax=Nocardia sp. CA-128927 TaxID=3239975 RepID=UPI003D975886